MTKPSIRKRPYRGRLNISPLTLPWQVDTGESVYHVATFTAALKKLASWYRDRRRQA